MNPITHSPAPSPPRPRAAGASPLFTFASGGHLSFNSERKVRKNATKTYGFGFPQRATPCRKFVSHFLAQSPFPCTVVGQKDCATTAFRCRFAAAACCHGRSFPLYRRTGVLPSQRSRPRCCHCEPVTDVTGVAIRLSRPRAAGAESLLPLPPAGYFCHQRQKYPKTPLETTFQDFLSALRPVSNLTHVPRAIGFSVYRCRSKGLCPHSFPPPLRCRCPVPR